MARARRRRWPLVLAGLALVLLVTGYLFRGYLVAILPGQAPSGALPLGRLHLPAGFVVEAFAEDLTGARSLALGPDGLVAVGTRDPGRVYVLRDADRDGRAEQRWTVATGLRQPNGVAWRGADLYVAEIGRVLRLPDLARALDAPPAPVVVTDAFPEEGHHGWKFIAFGPDGLLYVPVGAPCNVCLSEDPAFAAIHRLRPDGTGLEPFAVGVRNTVGFDWDPATGDLWFTDNGRDWMGPDQPPDELNHAPRPGLHFGFPFCHGRDLVDPDHGGRDCAAFMPPRATFQAHAAALGMRFYDGAMFPARYRGGVFVALHGSWNRPEPVGYEVVFVPMTPDGPGPPEPFVTGWLGAVGAWGRPVDVEVLPDGSLLVSDDRADAVYRVRYSSAPPTDANAR